MTHPLYEALTTYEKSGKIVDLRLRNGDRIIGPIMGIDDQILDIAPVVDLDTPSRAFHDDLTILVSEVVAVGIHRAEYRKD